MQCYGQETTKKSAASGIKLISTLFFRKRRKKQTRQNVTDEVNNSIEQEIMAVDNEDEEVPPLSLPLLPDVHSQPTVSSQLTPTNSYLNSGSVCKKVV